MPLLNKPVGFGGAKHVAEFFDVPVRQVLEKARSGEWPSYLIAGQRVFDVDELLRILVGQADPEMEGPAA